MERLTLGDWIFINMRNTFDPLFRELVKYWENKYEPIEDEV